MVFEHTSFTMSHNICLNNPSTILTSCICSRVNVCGVFRLPYVVESRVVASAPSHIPRLTHTHLTLCHFLLSYQLGKDPLRCCHRFVEVVM